MKWKKSQYSESAFIGDGLITAEVHWALSGKGYSVFVNRDEICISDDIESAKKMAENNIKARLLKAINQFQLYDV